MPKEHDDGRVKTATDYLMQRQPPTTHPHREFNDYPDYFYAGFWIRLFAFLVDVLCIRLISSIVFTLGVSLVGISEQANTFLAGRVIDLAIYLAYFIVLTKLTNGQTVGKMIFGIQVVCFKEETLSWSTVLVREGACRFVLQLNLLLVGYVVAAFTPSKQHLGDLFSDTSVVTLNTLKASQKLAS